MLARFIFTFLLLLTTARADDFKVFRTSEILQEGPRLELLNIDTAKLRFKLAPPRDYIQRTDEQGKTITLESRDGQTAIAFLFTTNSPSALPPEEKLKSRLTNLYPGAIITATGPCRARPEPGVYYELKRSAGDSGTMIINHSFVPSPEGVVEVVFRTNGEAYKKEYPAFNIMLMTFQREPKPVPK